MTAAKLVFILLSCLLLFAYFELVVEYPVIWWWYAIFCTLLLLQIFVTLKNGWSFKTQVSPLLGIFVTAVLYFTNWSIRKPFIQDFQSIHSGMSKDMAIKTMSGYILAYDKNDSICFRHTDDGAYDADLGIVHFTNNKVNKVRFLPD